MTFTVFHLLALFVVIAVAASKFLRWHDQYVTRITLRKSEPVNDAFIHQQVTQIRRPGDKHYAAGFTQDRRISR